MNSITTPELLAQVNTENQTLLADFLAYLRAVKRSETTVFGYENDIHIAWVWCLCYNENKFFVNWSKRDVLAYQNWLVNQNGNSPARVRRLKAALSSLSNYILLVLDEDFPDFKNIISKIESPINQPVREKTVWEDEELEILLSKLDGPKDCEKACFLALAMYSGRRKSELCRFKVSDFSDENLVCGGALWKSNPIKTKGRGDGLYIPCYTLAKKFRPYLERWLVFRKEQKIESPWLFPDKGKPEECIKITTVNSWAKTFSRMAGKPAYMHSMRHYFITSLAKAGIPDGVIQSIVSWKSSDMVRLYTDLDVEEQIGMYFKDGEIFVPGQKTLGEI